MWLYGMIRVELCIYKTKSLKQLRTKRYKYRRSSSINYLLLIQPTLLQSQPILTLKRHTDPINNISYQKINPTKHQPP